MYTTMGFKLKLVFLLVLFVIASESEARNVVHIACTQGCFHTGPCVNNYCTCNKEQAGKLEFCCDSCVGFLCFCPPTREQCEALCPHAFTNMFPISQNQSP
ncbi:unnamed protein product [Vicia faba]|uniref:Uncharacterized protein n=1 Tax=Vicia faba TaxID=3906 RepID=A0AAV0ZEI5_VICFA|nr:unnamed protein product [Vicia faba]